MAVQLIQDEMFIKEIIPYDFTATLGQYAIEITYTNDEKQVLTTPHDPAKGAGTPDFENYEEFVAFYEKYKHKSICQFKNSKV